MVEVASRRARAVRIHCPIAADTLSALLAGDLAAIEADATAARILAILRADAALGNFGRYRGVFELGFGMEGFTPAEDAVPMFGTVGAQTLSPTATITSYADADADLSAVLSKIVAAHPWEVPVIEIGEPVTLVSRA